jgi:hypothetical protein
MNPNPKIRDFLTNEQIRDCADLYPQRMLIRDRIIKPNIQTINRKLGQENDPDMLSYIVIYHLATEIVGNLKMPKL